MRDIINSIRLIILKNRLWLILSMIAALMISVSNNGRKISNFETDIINGLLYIEEGISYYSASHKRLEERFDKGISQEDIKTLKDYYAKNIKTWNEVKLDDRGNITGYGAHSHKITPLNPYVVERWFFRYGYFEDEDLSEESKFSSDERERYRIKRTMEFEEFDGAKFVVGRQIGIFFLMSIFLGILLSSIEYLTPFYEFIRGLPWIREKTYLARVLIGILIILILLILSSTISYFMIRRNTLSGLMNYGHISNYIFKYLVMLSAIFIFVLTVGHLSGNIVGHMGLLIIFTAPYYVISFNIKIIGNILGHSVYHDIEKFYDNLPEIVQFLLNPTRNFQYEEIPYFVLWGLIFLIMGLIVQNQYDGSKVTNLVQGKILSKVAMVLGIFTTAGVFQEIFFSILYIAGPIQILSYVVFLFISYQFYKRIFAVQIGI